MIWQDMILVICTIAMGYALVPQIFDNMKVRRCQIGLQTSGVTFIAVFVAAIIYLTLGLFFTFILTSVIGILWFVLFVQKIIYK